MSVTPAKLSANDKFTLITQNVAEVLGAEQLRALLDERDVIAYWGTAPTGRPHLGYFAPLVKLADFLTAGVEVKVLLADVHAFLDNLKAPIELVARRVDYYKLLLTSVLSSLKVPVELLTFVVGSDYQYSQAYNLDKYKLCSITTEHDARKAGAEVVKQVTSPLLSGLLYPLLQALDEEYLGVDFQFGGVDQRKIFTYAESALPKLGYKKRSHLMNAMVPGLSGGKMSSSDPNSKIDFLDSPSVVKSKIAKAVCTPGEIEGNGVLAFIRSVIVPIGNLMKFQGRPQDRIWVQEPSRVDILFTIVGDPKFGGTTLNFESCDELEKAYAENLIHPNDLKNAVVIAINYLLKPVQEDFIGNPEFKKLEELAYPVEVKEIKKKVKVFTPKPDHILAKEKEEKEKKELSLKEVKDALP